jgi:adenylate cyclase
MRIQQRLGVACKVSLQEQIAGNILSAYLGPKAGAAVIGGQIKLGDGRNIHAVIWYNDLRRSTAMADAMAPGEFLTTLNEYFQCTAGAVLAHGGEVLRFVGDAVLAIFPVEAGGDDEATACGKAMAAATEARRRLGILNDERIARGLEPVDFGLGLHLGDVMFGNIGVPERVEFSVIGAAANEVARVEDLTKTLGQPLLASADVARWMPGRWYSLGPQRLRGVADPLEVFAPR